MLLALAGAVAMAQTAQTGSVSGTVTNSVTGEPILRAHVMLRGATRESGPAVYGALTNQEGKFNITQVPPGRYSLFAERIGFVPPFDPNGERAPRITLAAGDNKTELKLTLIPAGAITGRVLDSAGEPVSDAMVRVEGTGGAQNTTADERGRYRIGGLRPGKYRIQAGPQPSPFPTEIRTDGSKDVHHAATYHSGSLTRAGSLGLDVPPGQDLSDIDIRLVATPVVSVTGRIYGMPPRGHADLGVTREGENSMDGPPSYVKPDGTFVISPVDPGRYYLVASAEGGLRRLQSAPVEIDVAGANVEHVELRMIPAFDISGQVRFDDESIRAARQNQSGPQPMTRQITFWVIPMPLGNHQTAMMADDDTFELQKMTPGRYQVSVLEGYVRALRVGDSETDGAVLDLRNGPAGPVTLFVSGLTAEVSGIVTDSNGPAANTEVVLVSNAGGSPLVRNTTTKADGTYQFTRLPPGKYQLASVDGGFFPNANSDAPLEDYADIAEAVELHPGDKITKDLKRK